MIWIDYAIIAFVGFSALFSLLRGFIQEVLSILTKACAFFVAINFYSYLADYLTFFEDKVIRNGTAIFIFFILVLFAGAISNCMVSVVVRKAGLSGTDRLFGILFGVFRGVLIVSAILFFLNTFTSVSKSVAWKQSNLIPQFNCMIRWFLSYIHKT